VPAALVLCRPISQDFLGLIKSALGRG